MCTLAYSCLDIPPPFLDMNNAVRIFYRLLFTDIKELESYFTVVYWLESLTRRVRCWKFTVQNKSVYLRRG